MVTDSEGWVWECVCVVGVGCMDRRRDREGKPIHSQALIRRVLPSYSLGKARGSAAIKE